MTDFSHLDALQGRLHREQMRLNDAERAIDTASKTASTRLQNEIEFRKREIASCQREIAGEYRFLGIEPPSDSVDYLSDEELMKALTE